MKILFGKGLIVALFALHLAACKEELPQKYKKQFILLAPEKTGIDFKQSITEEYRYNWSMDPNIFNGGGVAVLDINNDGLQDLFFTSRLQPCRLYLNKGEFQFEDISEAAGLTKHIGIKTGVSVVDVNSDGWMDIYVCRTFLEPIPERRNLLFINQKNNSFSEEASKYGLDDLSPTQHAHFFDYDLDGDLDCYLLNHPITYNQINNIDFQPSASAPWAAMRPPLDEFESDKLLRNDGGKFVDVSKKAGINNRAWGLSVMSNDLNADGFPDLYIANDFIMPDFTYINNGDGTFSERNHELFQHTSNHTMGIEIADLTNDGLCEIIGLDMLGENWQRRHQQLTTMQLERHKQLQRQGYGDQQMRNVMQLALGNPKNEIAYAEVGCLAGMFATEWGWAPLAADFDNDGWNDLFITNGVRRDLNDIDFFVYTADSINQTGGINPARFKTWESFSELMPTKKIRNRMFRNNGTLQLEDVTNDWGFETPTWSNGAAYTDLDNDGDLDLVVHNVDDTPYIYKNTAEENGKNWLQVKLKGSPQNPLGTGAKIWVKLGNELRYCEMSPTHGFYSSVEPIFQVGIGTSTTIDEVRVQWPNKKHQVLKQVKINQRLILDINEASDGNLPLEKLEKNKYFEAIPIQNLLTYAHLENEHEDFNTERLLPHRFSNQGPCLSVGDVNADGLEDFFVGGAKGQSGAIFTQNANGGFSKSQQPALEADTQFEDTGSLLFDADGDKDLDLYVVSGGNEAAAGDPIYQDRLYLNDGKAHFQKNETALPKETASGKAIVSHDFDKDGDQDLFVGGRVVPHRFPEIPECLVLQNEGGKFTNVTDQVLPSFRNIGMVTDLAVADLDGDKNLELVVVGEWMPVTIFDFNKNHQPTTIKSTEGWWNSLSISDLDGDGDNDILAGNLGLNTRFRPPMRLYAKDFDANGSLDPIHCVQEDGRFVPVPMRDNLLKQLPYLKKKFVRNTSYSLASIEQVFSPSELEGAQTLTTEILATVWFENKGNGEWETHLLPDEAQISPSSTLLIDDFTADGQPDILLAGNDSGYEVETGPVNTSPGFLLAGDGKGGFKAISPSISGFWAKKEVREMQKIKLGKQGQNAIIIANNNDGLQLLQQVNLKK